MHRSSCGLSLLLSEAGDQGPLGLVTVPLPYYTVRAPDFPSE